MLSIRYFSILSVILCASGAIGCHSNLNLASKKMHPSHKQGTKEYSKRMFLVAQKFEEQGNKKQALNVYKQLIGDTGYSHQAHDRILALTNPQPIQINTKRSSRTMLANNVSHEKKMAFAKTKVVSKASFQNEWPTAKASQPFPKQQVVTITPAKKVAVVEELTEQTVKVDEVSSIKIVELNSPAINQFPASNFEIASTLGSNTKLPSIVPNDNQNSKAVETVIVEPLLSDAPGKFPVVSNEPKLLKAPQVSGNLPPSPFEPAKFPEDESFKKPVPELNSYRWTAKTNNSNENTSSTISAHSLIDSCPDATEEMKYLIAQLASNESVQKNALIELSRMGENAKPALPAIDKLLSSNSASILSHVLWSKTQIEGPKQNTVEDLTSILDSTDSKAVETTAYFLGKLGEDANVAVPKLEQLLENGNSLVQLHAAESLLKISPENSNASSTLLDILKRGDDQVRWMAAFAAGSISANHHPEVIQELSQSLYDTDSRVQEAAALTLGGFGNQGRVALNELIRVSHSEDLKNNPGMKAAVEIALECIEAK